eukprot:2215107-Amphidinium_carterae.1
MLNVLSTRKEAHCACPLQTSGASAPASASSPAPAAPTGQVVEAVNWAPHTRIENDLRYWFVQRTSYVKSLVVSRAVWMLSVVSHRSSRCDALIGRVAVLKGVSLFMKPSSSWAAKGSFLP